jgi:tetratricopeptide (TPR) repeat protein
VFRFYAGFLRTWRIALSFGKLSGKARHKRMPHSQRQLGRKRNARRRLLLASALILLAAGTVRAASLHGVVWANRQRLPRARITLEQNGAVVGEQYTDNNGNFRFGNLVPGAHYEVFVRHPGFLPVRLEVRIRHPEQQLSPDIFLQAEPKKVESEKPVVDVKELERGDAGALLHKATQQVAAGKYSEAIQTLGAAIEQKPQDARLHEALGLALFKAQRFEEAIATLHKAARLGGSHAPLYLAAVCNSSGRHLDAEVAAEEAVAADPSSWEAWYELGRAQFHLGLWPEAERSYQRALQPKGSSPSPEKRQNGRVHLGLANLYLKTGRFPLASEHFAIFVKEEPNAPEASQVRRILQEMESAGLVTKQR